MDVLKNLLLAGLGAVSYSQEKLKDAVEALIQKGSLTREQGEKVISEWAERGREEQDRVSEKLADDIKKALNKLPIVTRDEFEALVARVTRLEEQQGGE